MSKAKTQCCLLAVITVFYCGCKTDLKHAVEKGDLEKIKKAIGRGENVNEVFDRNDTALIIAVKKCRADVAEYLIENGAQIDVKDDAGLTALMWAVKNGDEKNVALLLNKGARVDIKDEYDTPALNRAIIDGHVHIAELLIDNGAKIERKDKDGNTALMAAAANNRIGIARKLLEKSVSLNEENLSGNTARMLAEMRGNKAIAEILAEHGAEAVPLNHSGFIRAVAFSEDGQITATASSQQTIKLWRTADGVLIRTLKIDFPKDYYFNYFQDPPDQLYFASGKIIVTSNDNLIVWNITSGKEELRFRAKYAVTDRIGYIQYYRLHHLIPSPKADVVLAENYSKETLDLYDLRSGSKKTSFPLDSQIVFSPDGRFLAVASGEYSNKKSFRLWRLKDRFLVLHLNKTLRGIAFSADGRFLAAVGSDKIIYVFESEKGKVIGRVKLDSKDDVSSPILCFSPNGGILAFAEKDEPNIHLLDVKDGCLLFRLSTSGEPVKSFFTGPDGMLFIDTSGMIFAFKISDGRLVWKNEYKEFNHLWCLSPNGKMLIASYHVGFRPVIELLAAGSGRRIHNFSQRGFLENSYPSAADHEPNFEATVTDRYGLSLKLSHCCMRNSLPFFMPTRTSYAISLRLKSLSENNSVDQQKGSSSGNVQYYARHIWFSTIDRLQRDSNGNTTVLRKSGEPHVGVWESINYLYTKYYAREDKEEYFEGIYGNGINVRIQLEDIKDIKFLNSNRDGTTFSNYFPENESPGRLLIYLKGQNNGIESKFAALLNVGGRYWSSHRNVPLSISPKKIEMRIYLGKYDSRWEKRDDIRSIKFNDDCSNQVLVEYQNKSRRNIELDILDEEIGGFWRNNKYMKGSEYLIISKNGYFESFPICRIKEICIQKEAELK